MKKKYIITEFQYNQLVKNKKKNSSTLAIYVANDILEEIEKTKKNLNEGEMLNEAIVDTIRKYLKKGLLTTAVIASLLANNVQAETLAQAGVSPQKIEQAQTQGGEISPEKVEQKLLNVLKKRGQDGIVRQYSSLDDNQKNELLATIGKSIDKLSDIDKYEYRITDWLSKKIEDSRYSKIDQNEKITVDTVTVNIVKDFMGNFNANSSVIQNEGTTKQELQEIFNAFDEIQKITIIAASSTLRNTGESEGKTWKELSTERAKALSNIVVGMNYNLGGLNVNQSHTINDGIINYDVGGQNGDGSSGPKSPFEVNPETVKFYQEKNIDPSLWKSTATQEPYSNKADYLQHQYVKVVITGNIVENDTDQIVNYKYLVMKEKQDDIKVTKSKHQDKKVGKKGIIPCPIKIKT